MFKFILVLELCSQTNICCEHQISSGNLIHDSAFDKRTLLFKQQSSTNLCLFPLDLLIIFQSFISGLCFVSNVVRVWLCFALLCSVIKLIIQKKKRPKKCSPLSCALSPTGCWIHVFAPSPVRLVLGVVCKYCFAFRSKMETGDFCHPFLPAS